MSAYAPGLSYDFPVGTERVDPDGKEEHVHYPTPSSDPSDPLNWSKKWKVLSFIAVQNYVTWVTIAVSALSSIYIPLIISFNATVNEIAALTSWMAFLLGVGNFFWIPWSTAWGRRPVIFFSNLTSIAMSFWFPASKTYKSAFVARTLIGFTSAPLEIIGPYQIGDVFFTSERGFYHGLSFCILCTATNIASPLAAGFEQSGVGWRAFFYWISGMIAASQIAIFFICPETKWKRDPVGTLDVTHPPSAIETSPAAPMDTATSLEKEKASTALSTIAVLESQLEEKGLTVALVGKGNPTRTQKYGLFPPKDPDYNILKELWMVFAILRFPATWLIGIWWLAYGGQAASVGYVASYVWSSPPYEFTTGQIGATAIPGIVGNLLGFLAIGPLSDWDLARRTRNNGGIREPEMRLWLAVPGAAIYIIGIIIFAYGVDKGWHWAIPLVLGQGVGFFGATFPIVISCTYAIDTYKQYAGEIAFNMTLWKDFYTFALGYFINDLILARGKLIGVVLPAIPVYFAFILTLVFIWFGKDMRRWTSTSNLLKISR